MDNDLLIRTKRLLLRPIQSEDSEMIFAYRSDSFVNRYQGWIPETIADVYDFINYRTSPEIDLPGSWFQFVILKPDSNEIIGDVGVHFLDLAGFQTELGCTLSSRHHGNGFATEALTGIMNYLFDTLGKQLIIASIDPRNEKSISLFQRLGFSPGAQNRQTIKHSEKWADDLVFVLNKEDWPEK